MAGKAMSGLTPNQKRLRDEGRQFADIGTAAVREAIADHLRHGRSVWIVDEQGDLQEIGPDHPKAAALLADTPATDKHAAE